jgi:hypothetical protein
LIVDKFEGEENWSDTEADGRVELEDLAVGVAE